MGLDRIDLAAIAVAALVVLSRVIGPATIGLADNGDFAKISGRFSLHPAVADADASFQYATDRYERNPKYYWNSGFLSSEFAFAYPAVAAATLISETDTFDIRFLGALHGALFLTAFALAMPLFHAFQKTSRLILIGLVILVFCDDMYVTYFNSFYMDTAAILFLLTAGVLFLRASYLPRSGFTTPLLLVCCCLFVLAKAQHALLGIPMTLLFLSPRVLLWPSFPALSRSIAVGSLLGCSALQVLSTTPDYKAYALFNAIFLGLAPSARNPSAELHELALDDSYLRYKGMFSFNSDSPLHDAKWSAHFTDTTSHSRLGLFYLRHPLRMAYILRTSLDDAGFQRPRLYGNFDKTAGRPARQMSSFFALWSTIKAKLFADHGWIYLTYFLILIAILVLYDSIGALVLGVISLSALAIGGLADFADGTRHLYVFNVLVDFTAICVVSAAVYRRKNSARPESSSIRHVASPPPKQKPRRRPASKPHS
jgi:hypothetical protein